VRAAEDTVDAAEDMLDAVESRTVARGCWGMWWIPLSLLLRLRRLTSVILLNKIC
jgi:hypothetical protein